MPNYPTAISTLLRQNQPLIPSAERSQYSETREIWQPSSGSQGEKNPLGIQIINAGELATFAAGIYKAAPTVASVIYDALPDPEQMPSGDFSFTNSPKNIAKNLGRLGKESWKSSAKAGTSWYKNMFKYTGIDINQEPSTFWYNTIQNIEQTGFDIPILKNVVSMFTKATYLSDILSFSTQRTGPVMGGQSTVFEHFFDISNRALEGSKKDTINVFADQMVPQGVADRAKKVEELKRKLSQTNYLIYNEHKGKTEVYAGRLNLRGEIEKVGESLSSSTKLVNKGPLTEAMLGIVYPDLGNKSPFTGGTYAETVGGSNRYLLMSRETIDKDIPALGKLFIDPIINFINRFKRNPIKSPITTGNKILLAESYVSMALQRTSKLFSEMFNEVGSFGEYLFPDSKKNIFSFAFKHNLTPKLVHGHAATMLGRYAALAMSIGGALMAANQISWSMIQGNKAEKLAMGSLQTAGLTYLGGLISGALKKNKAIGAGIGFGLGLLGQANIGPFSRGPIPGAANLIARSREILSYATEGLGSIPFIGNDWRRGVEEMMPGSTGLIPSLGMGVLLGSGYVFANRALNKHKVIESSHRSHYLQNVLKLQGTEKLKDVESRLSSRKEELIKLQSALHHAEMTNDSILAQQAKAKLESHLDSNYRNMTGLSESQIHKIEDEIQTYMRNLRRHGQHSRFENYIGKNLTGTLNSNIDDLAEDITSKVEDLRRSKVLRTEPNLFKRIVSTIEHAPRLKAIGYASLLGAAAWYTLTGSIGTIEKPHELREKNQGKRLEAVRRSQKWEMGQGSLEGDDLLFYRPTLTARLSSGAVQAGGTGNHGPIPEFLLKNFTYKLERENYWKRPAPITGAAGDQIPFIYPALQPILDLIKSPKLMHVGEWAKTGFDGNPLYLERSDGLDEIPDGTLKSKGMPAPYSPYQPGRVLGRFWEQTTDLAGLVGYYGRTAKLMLTGSKSFYDQRSQLESFSENSDITSKFYDLHGGGSFLGLPMTSEPIRRFLKKNELKQYNPIQNTMPTWLPNNMKYGNPFTDTRYGNGEFRVPGEGYEALHPELKGYNPEDYPLLHRLNILGDVAPYSSEYKKTLRDAKKMAAEGDMTSNELSFFYRHQQQIEEKRNKRLYDNYKFKPSTYDTISGTISSVDPETMSFTLNEYGGRFGISGIGNSMPAIISTFNASIKEAAKIREKNKQVFSEKVKKGMGVTVTLPGSIGQAVGEDGIIKAGVRNNLFSVNQDLREEGNFASEKDLMSSWGMTNPIGHQIGKVWEATTHIANKVAQPVEHLFMFGAAPINKLLPFRDALEDYESRELYGTEMKSWEQPIKGWLGPAISSALHNWLGLDFETPGIRKKRDTEEYFDKLKYLKYKGLAQAASEEGNLGLEQQYTNIANHTSIGGNGWTSEGRLGNALGGRESIFATGFANEANQNRQADIIDALPSYKQKTMRDYYLNADLMAINRSAGMAPMSTTAMDYLQELTTLRDNSGYQADENPDEIRNKELEKYFRHKTLPSINWIGFNPAVDLEDVKLKYAESEGIDYHSLGIFPSRESYLHRKEYITEAMIEDLNNISISNGLSNLARAGTNYDQFGHFNHVLTSPINKNSIINLTYKETVDFNPFSDY